MECPSARDGKFIDNSIRLAIAVITSGFVMQIIPKALELLLVWILVSCVRFHYSKLSRVLEPLFQDTKSPKQASTDVEDNGSRGGGSEAETAIQWPADNTNKDPNIHPKEPPLARPQTHDSPLRGRRHHLPHVNHRASRHFHREPGWDLCLQPP
jgi:hypothetical protein